MVLAVEVWVVDWSGISMRGADPTNLVPQVFGNEDLVVVTLLHKSNSGSGIRKSAGDFTAVFRGNSCGCRVLRQ